MPLPILLAGAAIAAGIGIKKSVNAHSDNQRAQAMNNRAWEAFDQSQRRLIEHQVEARATLERLGLAKLDFGGHQLGRFVKLYKLLNDVPEAEGLTTEPLGGLTQEDIEQLDVLARQAREVSMDGPMAVGAGALAGLAAYGGFALFGTTAATGATIAMGTTTATFGVLAAATGSGIAGVGLAGLAASMPSLAVGGTAVTVGGTAVAAGSASVALLGGVVAGPAIAVGGWLLAARAGSNLEEATRNFEEAQRLVEVMDGAVPTVQALYQLAEDYHTVLCELDIHLTQSLDELAELIGSSGQSFDGYNSVQQAIVQRSVFLAQTMRCLLTTPLLSPGDSINPDAEPNLEAARIALTRAA